MNWQPQSDCECSVINKTPTNSTEHIEGYIFLTINQDCLYHGQYLNLPNVSNEFSIELIQQLEKQYEETC